MYREVDIYAKVRRAVMVEGLSERGAARQFGLSRKTVSKMIRHTLPPGYQRKGPPVSPKLGPFVGIIELSSQKAPNHALRLPARHPDACQPLSKAYCSLDAAVALEVTAAGAENQLLLQAGFVKPDDLSAVLSPADIVVSVITPSVLELQGHPGIMRIPRHRDR